MNQTSILVLLCLTALVFAQRGDENDALRRRRRLVYGVKPNEKNEADKAEFFSETFDELDENWHRVLDLSVSGKGKGSKSSKSSKSSGKGGKGGKGSKSSRRLAHDEVTFDDLDENWHRVLDMSVSGKGKGSKGSKSSKSSGSGKGKGGKGSRL